MNKIIIFLPILIIVISIGALPLITQSNSEQTQALFDAIVAIDVNKVKEAIAQGANINVKAHKETNQVQSNYKSNGYTPLMMAIIKLGEEMISAQKTLNNITGCSAVALGTSIPLATLINYAQDKSLLKIVSIGAACATGALITRWGVKEYQLNKINTLVEIIDLLLEHPHIKVNKKTQLGSITALTLLDDYQKVVEDRMFSLFGFKLETEFTTIFDNICQKLIDKGAKTPIVKVVINQAQDMGNSIVKRWINNWLEKHPFIFQGL